MTTISAAGIGSGLDVQSIVSQLVALERAPIKQLQAQASTLQTRLSQYGTIKSQVATLADAAARLTQSSTWQATTATSSNAAAVTVTASTGALNGAHTVQVQQLASAQSAASAVLAPAAVVGTGTLTIEIGRWSGSSFTAGDASSVQVEIDPGEDDLASIAAKINAAKAGVRASVLRDANGKRLLVQSVETGEAKGFRITVADDDGNDTDAAGLSALAFDLANGQGMGLAQAASDAQVLIDGVAIAASSNRLEDVLPGVTLQLGQVTSQPVEVRIDVDHARIAQDIRAFVDAYNALDSTLANALKYDAASGKAGALQGDATAVGLQQALRAMMRSVSASEPFTRLLDVGIELSSGGGLRVDDGKLAAALDHLDDVRALFTIKTGEATTQGFALKVRDFARGLLDSEGSLSTRTSALQSAISRNTKEQERQEARVERVEARLLAQYGALDTKLASLNTLSAFVAQQVSLWSKIG